MTSDDMIDYFEEHYYRPSDVRGTATERLKDLSNSVSSFHKDALSGNLPSRRVLETEEERIAKRKQDRVFRKSFLKTNYLDDTRNNLMIDKTEEFIDVAEDKATVYTKRFLREEGFSEGQIEDIILAGRRGKRRLRR